MATENEQNSATQQTSKEEEKAQPKTEMVRRSQDTGLARSHRVGGLGLPLTPYEMLRMSPFALFRRMTEELDRALQPFSPENEGNANIAWTPTVEISERDGNYHVLAELPGLSPSQIRIEVEDDALILQGERKVEREATEGGVRRSERQFGFFYRRIPLPEGAEPEKAKATFRDGVLEIIMPAPKQKAERQQIQIEADTKAPPASETASSVETKKAAA
jgi:HSP20 family protein